MLGYLIGFLLISTLVTFAAFKIFFSIKKTDAIINANQKNKGKYYMKKYPEANVLKFSGVFRLIGILISMGFVLAAFNYQDRPEEVMDLGEVMEIEEVEELPPPSVQKPPPPPPPPPPPKLEIVEDEEIIEEEPEIIETEAEEETVVEIPDEIDYSDDEGDEEVEEVIEEEPEPEEPEIFTIVEQMPEFKGGQKALYKYINKNIKYPPIARENGISGTVYVEFIIRENGDISDVVIKRGLQGGGAGCDDEAVRVVRGMPKWNPGKQRGKTVPVKFVLPIKFKLE